MSKDRSPIVVAVPGDLHLTRAGMPNHRQAHQAIEEVKSLIRPDFAQFIGDNVQDATEDQFRLFDDLRSRLDVPHFALVGDHDVDRESGIENYRAHLGEPFGATRLRGYRFLRLNTREAAPVGFGPEQIAWLRDQLEDAKRQSERVAIFQHNYPYQIWEDYAGEGVDDWRVLLQTYRIEAIICGHTHYQQTANDGRNVFYAVRSIGDPEGGCAGYAVAFFGGDDVAIGYRTVLDTEPFVLITHPRASILATGPSHVAKGEDEMRVRVWARTLVSNVKGWIDKKGPIELRRTGETDWAGKLDAIALSKGEHLLEVVALLEDGRTGSAMLDFFVDPTGRYTPVPRARPWVTETKHCES